MQRESVGGQFFDSQEHDFFAVSTDNEAVGWEYSLDCVDTFVADPE